MSAAQPSHLDIALQAAMRQRNDQMDVSLNLMVSLQLANARIVELEKQLAPKEQEAPK